MARLELDVTELIKTSRGQMWRFCDPANKWDAWAASLRAGRRYDWVNDENRRTLLSRRGAYVRTRSSKPGLSRRGPSPRIARTNAAEEWGEQKWDNQELTAAEHWDDETLKGLIVETVAIQWLEKSTMAECVRYRERDDTWWFPLVE